MTLKAALEFVQRYSVVKVKPDEGSLGSRYVAELSYDIGTRTFMANQDNADRYAESLQFVLNRIHHLKL